MFEGEGYLNRNARWFLSEPIYEGFYEKSDDLKVVHNSFVPSNYAFPFLDKM